MILLDTHVLLWLAMDRERFKKAMLARIADAIDHGTAQVSVASLWEIATLHRRRRLTIDRPLHDWIELLVGGQGVIAVPVDAAIAVEAGGLSNELHGDPGDRMIIATARVRRLELVTADSAILRYAAAGYVKAIDARS